MPIPWRLQNTLEKQYPTCKALVIFFYLFLESNTLTLDHERGIAILNHLQHQQQQHQQQQELLKRGIMLHRISMSQYIFCLYSLDCQSVNGVFVITLINTYM